MMTFKKNLYFIWLLFAGVFLACEKEMPTDITPVNPRLTVRYLPETIEKSDTTTALFMVHVTDAQGLSTIERVSIELQQQNQTLISGDMWDDGQNGDIIAHNGTYTFAIIPSHTPFSTGEIVVKFSALDSDGHTSAPSSDTLSVEEVSSNQPPKIEEVQGPVTISRSQGGVHLLRATVSDPQGLDDIQKVFFNSFLPNGSPSSGNPFIMYDTGANGDQTAGDGIYSFQFTISAGNALGDYRFEIQAQDKSGAKSEIVVHTISVIQ